MTNNKAQVTYVGNPNSKVGGEKCIAQSDKKPTSPNQSLQNPSQCGSRKKKKTIALKACWDVSSFDHRVFIAVNKASAHKQQREDKISRQDSREQVGFFFSFCDS